MAVSVPQQVSLSEVSASRELRLDPHHHGLFAEIKDFVDGLRAACPLAEPLLSGLSNGLNLPQAAYAPLDEGSYLYASVGAFSQFAFRPGRCQSLLSPDIFEYAVDLECETLGVDELVITRSGTPGIAWARSADAEASGVIPSGFVIRGNVNRELALPTYLAAVLNHPIWRIWSASLAGGKRQRNLTQEHLMRLAVPLLSIETQESVADLYDTALADLDTILAAEVSILGMCDEILDRLTPLNLVTMHRERFTCDRVSLGACVASAEIRLDARFHRGDIRKSLAALDGCPSLELHELLSHDVIKGKQPQLIDDGVGGAVVATSSIQAGTVHAELFKSTPEEAVEAAGDRRLRCGDLLIAMDGEGSIGKAAVYDHGQPAITDSHLGILRLRDGTQAEAIACFLNSSLGQAQIETAISGSTGQTQLAARQIHRIRVPSAVLGAAAEIDEAYRSGLTAYEPLPQRVRRRLCVAEATIGELLLDADLSRSARRYLKRMTDLEALVDLLGLLKPRMF